MKQVLGIILGASMLMLIACESGQQTDSPSVATSSNEWVNSSNKQLAKYPVTGFAYKSTEMPSQRWDRWARVAAPAVKTIINQMPNGFVLQVTGHADATGPEYATENKPGNMQLSEGRAKTVYDALRRQGVSSNKMTYKGVGSSQPEPGTDPTSGQNRRVTFQVVEK